MKTAQGIITLVQEGRFSLVTDGGRVIQFVLAHDARVEPQDLPRLEKKQCRVRVDYTKLSRILAHLAHALWTADDKPIERIEG